MQVHFETLGCRLNQDETEGAARAFARAGFAADLAPLAAGASAELDAAGGGVVLSIVNTCTVTGKAEQKARRVIRLLLGSFPHAPVLVTGCYAELDGDAVRAICPERVAVLPGTRKASLARLAAAMGAAAGCLPEPGGNAVPGGNALPGGLRWDGRGPLSAAAVQDFVGARCAVPGGSGVRGAPLRAPVPARLPADPFALYTPVFARHSRSSLKVQDGCGCACSFCRIHLARGAPVSLGAEEAVRRARELEASGAGEIVLTGVNLSQYSAAGADGGRLGFPGLLEELLRGTDRVAFRVSSLYPQAVTEELCGVLASPRVRPFFHLSIQSGSDAVLRRMNRPHDVAQVAAAIARLRAAKDSPFISCDIIAGFPGESEEEFALTRRLCEEQRFAWIHAFPFSPRPGTPAQAMRPQVPERVKGERVRWLTERAVAGKLAYIREWEGREVAAIVEHPRPRDPSGAVRVVTANFLHAECPLPEGAARPRPRPGAAVAVRVGGALEESIRAGREADCLGAIATDADLWYGMGRTL